MKNLYIRFLIASAIVTLTFTACDKELEFKEKLVAAERVSADEDAGTWSMMVLNSPTQIAVAAPAAVGSATYQSELASIKTLQANLTSKQKKAIEYWSVGGVVRWNQIMRELVARFNLPPAPRPDGSYPIPDANNPFGDPNFPFSNPPYAARAYSYVSVAQFEALKAAWHYKYVYNRNAPYQNDPSIQALATTNVPSYPSEDAVVAAVTAKFLELLFPAAVEEIRQKAFEQRNAAIWAGKASASDVSAGVLLGEAVFTEVNLRAANDGMRLAVGNKTDWDAYKAACEARGETPWMSQDAPARPPLLMNFGNVRAWCMSTEDIVAERPAAPPSTSSEDFLEEVKEVKYYAENLTRERLKIVHYWADGVGTYTPPGHWNDIATEHIAGARWSEVRTARAYALLNMALHDAAVGCWNTKFYYFNPRPSQVDKSIKTATGLPNFPAYTSGHSTFSYSAATVLGYLFPNEAENFNAMANEASLSRLYGAIHYRSDIEMGSEHGKAIASYTIAVAAGDGAD